MKNIFKTCHVYRRADALFIVGLVNTAYGSIAVPPVRKLPASVTEAELGDSVLSVISGLPAQLTEVNLATARQPYLAALKQMGFRSSAAFENNASLVSIHFDGEPYEIVPHERDKHKAFVATGSTNLPHSIEAEQLGSAIIGALNVSPARPTVRGQ
jgi:hypothetical protein